MKSPDWLFKLPLNIITSAAEHNGIDPRLVAAICWKESAGAQYATRYEPHYKYINTPEVFARQLGITVETEVIHQKTSWGLMQVMGGVMRELGYKGAHPQTCATIRFGLDYGCRHLTARLRRYSGDVAKAVAAYNAGSAVVLSSGRFANQPYVDDVMRLYAEAGGKV